MRFVVGFLLLSIAYVFLFIVAIGADLYLLSRRFSEDAEDE